MCKLLSSNFARLWKSAAFWIIWICVLIFSVVTISDGAYAVPSYPSYSILATWDYYFFCGAPYMPVAYAVFISIFVGTDYADGTLRNKLVVGHTRTHVYLANLGVCFVAGLLFMMAWFAGGFSGLFWFESLRMGAGKFCIYICVAIGFTASFTALFTWISMMSKDKTRTLIFTLAAWLGLIFAASGIGECLNMLSMEQAVCRIGICLFELIPAGQTMLMHDVQIEHPIRLLVFSLVFTVYAILSGLAAFRKKDIN